MCDLESLKKSFVLSDSFVSNFMIIALFTTIHTAFPYMSHKGLLEHEKTDLELLFF